MDNIIISQHNIDAVVNNTKKIILTFITHEYCLMLLNWFYHLKKINLEQNVMVVCLDEEAYDFIKQHNIPGLLLDTNQQTEQNNEKIALIKKAYKENHHIYKAYCIDYFTSKYNVDLIHSDIDIIFLKDPFERLQNIIKNYDMGAYMDYTYEELVTGRPRLSEKGGFGFVIFYVTKHMCSMFFDYLKNNPLLIDNKDVGLSVIENHFKSIKICKLNAFLFTNYDIWCRDDIRNNIKNICYCVHYNTSENTWSTKMNKDKINSRNNIKIERMKKYGHWLL